MIRSDSDTITGENVTVTTTGKLNGSMSVPMNFRAQNLTTVSGDETDVKQMSRVP